MLPDPGWRLDADGSYEIIALVSNCGGGVSRERYTVSAGGAVKIVDGEELQGTTAICGRLPAGLHAPARPSADVGAYFAEMAWLEAAAVVAFRHLESDLRALGAPRSLVAAARSARADEIRHAREANALARRFAASERELDAPPRASRDRFAIALENAVEGCVRETYGALVAAYQARTARDPEIRRFFTRIAADEARHAELSHAIAAWIERDLDAGERARIAAAKDAAFAELLDTAGVESPFAELAALP